MRPAAEIMTQERVAVVDGLFSIEDDAPVLQSSTCTSCGTWYFPRAEFCRNPRCTSVGASLVDTQLGSRGRLHSVTKQAYQPPAPFRMEPWADHIVGLVEFPEGIRVLGLVVHDDYEQIDLDVPVELTFKTLYSDDHQRDVVTYAFRIAEALNSEDAS